jgi:hypothetical protein
MSNTSLGKNGSSQRAGRRTGNRSIGGREPARKSPSSPDVSDLGSPTPHDQAPAAANASVDPVSSQSQVAGVKRGNDDSTPDQDSRPAVSTKLDQTSSGPQAQGAAKTVLAKPLATHIRKDTDLFREPEARSITLEQLIAEVKGIYAGLVMIEARCIEVDTKQAEILASVKGSGHKGNSHARLEDEQYKALIALHKALLNEHHDFFLASQHPSASPALRRLAAKYAMPARMWRHGIHSFLELLRHRLPHSLDHMLAFIYIAYSMIALLYETVRSFKDTWIECLGDLARYRMAVEDDDIRDREVWTNVARFWYTKAADRSPGTGRLYHHLAILARPVLLLQLFFYTKALSVPSPFISARESILTLLQPVLDSQQTYVRASHVDLSFIRIHAMLFIKKDLTHVRKEMAGFLDHLDLNIARNAERWQENGTYIMAANCSALLSYGTEENELKRHLKNDPPELPDVVVSPVTFELARELTFSTLKISLQRLGDSNILPHVHFSLVFLSYVQRYPQGMALLEDHVPWQGYAALLNELLRFDSTTERLDIIQAPEFPQSQEKSSPRLLKSSVSSPLTEDFSIRGFIWAADYFPTGWFDEALADDDDARSLEKPSMRAERATRILWLSYHISKVSLLFKLEDRR